VELKVLFVCYADSGHSQSWINLLKGSGFDIRVFAYPIDFGNKYPPLPWHYPTYSIFKPIIDRQASEIHWLFPASWWLRPFLHPIAYKSRVPSIWLGKIIRMWQPDLIHSLSFDFGNILTWEALKHFSKEERPKWVISTWGTDINFGIQDSYMRPRISACIQECDGFMADCFRDIRNAISLGLAPQKLPGERPIPGTGGIDLDGLPGFQHDLRQRRLIVVPKAFDNKTNKTLPILDALRLCEDVLDSYHIFFLISSHEVRLHVEKLPQKLRERCICFPHILQQDLLSMYGSARVMVAPSMSDGTPNVMLEAMALGALPIMSPISSIEEWITDGENGLLTDALNPLQIADALNRALTDDDLCLKAAKINRRIICERANRKAIRTEVIDFYQRIINQQVNEI